MGIPKFFRYISERYPLTSQLIQENKIPEFDNLYLDFNAIIHNCSHPNDADAHFRMTEEQIFTAIFNYVDLLFGKIKPKKFLLLAVDGVAPRAKMNQQRSRRFRTAKESEEVREKALAKGEKLPEAKAFDSNCITPGTPFMARLSDQLRYFVNKKISEDSNWRNIEVVLSGHDVPGEGEHKIMEYIRLSRAQPNYNPNIRHCFYGLDADLIMLGLLSHDPHFCLLREEVKFGPASRKKNAGGLDSINFYLLHLCLMREYLDLEFHEIEASLPFGYNLERVIDDFILLAVFVGNDFLPNLPDLHIHENGLERLFEIYKKVLPSLDGYINDGGKIDVKRLQVILDEMAKWEEDVFQTEYADVNWFKGKQAKHVKEMETAGKKNALVLTRPQRDIFDKVKRLVLENVPGSKLAIRNDFPASERKFVSTLAEDLHLNLRWDEFDEEDVNLVTMQLPGHGDQEAGDDKDGEWEDEDDMESKAAVERVLRKYEKAKVFDDDEGGGFDARHARALKEKMDEWKRNYYRGKLEISYDNPEEMNKLAYRYVEGLQWVMHYYYSGIAAWGWFYDYHYAPRISDLRNVDKMTFDFELGTPFRPYEQLMGVLPAASMEHIPEAYRDLMYDPNSPILDFYPTDFESDLNGKKQEWEAIVKIPFIDEKRLLKAMASREHRLTPDERQRNGWAPSVKFFYNATGEPTVYPSSLPGFFPALHNCRCKMEPFDLPTLDGLHLIPGLRDGVFLGANSLAGFPSLKTLPHTVSLGHHGVNVHGSESRNKSMVVHIQNPYENVKMQKLAADLIGNRVFIGWPFLQEAKVESVSDQYFRYEAMRILADAPIKIVSNPHAPHAAGTWKSKVDRIEQFYSKKNGVITGNIDVLLHVRPLKGLKRLEDGALVKDYEGPDRELDQAVQMTLTSVVSEDERYLERPAPPIAEEFPEGSRIFFMGEHAYGVAAQVSATTENTLSVILAFFPSEKEENTKFKAIADSRSAGNYSPAFKVAQILGISGHALSKITSSHMVITSDNQKTNVGLSLKFEAKALKVVDYSRKEGRSWEFSDKAIDLLLEYKNKFPNIFMTLDAGGNGIAKASDILPGPDPDAIVRQIKAWLKSKGVRDFEPVSLFCDQLGKETVKEIEKLADAFNATKQPASIKKAIVKNIPRQAVLKPTHAVYRLQNQMFELGDRVTMVQDSGGVPLSFKGTVIGLNSNSMDVVWDVPFMAGTTLGDRCSQYRGSTVEFCSCLNLTKPQYISGNPNRPKERGSLKIGPRPIVEPARGQGPAAGFRPAVQQNGATPHSSVQIMSNPNRGRGASSAAWRGGHNNGDGQAGTTNGHEEERGPARGGMGFVPRGRGFRGGRGAPGFVPGFRGGRGGVGGERGGFRGRGRGGVVPPVTMPSS